MAQADGTSATDDAKARRRQAGEYLKGLRLESGLTQKELADRLNYEPYTFIAQVEGGVARVPPDDIPKWATVLCVNQMEFEKKLSSFYEQHEPGALINPSSASSDRANTLTEVRATILNESTRTLVAINGGGAVAVATWLQAVWERAWALPTLRLQVIGAGILLLGVAFASACPFVRYVGAFHRNTTKPLSNPWWWVNTALTVASMIAFIFGMALVVVGAWKGLP